MLNPAGIRSSVVAAISLVGLVGSTSAQVSWESSVERRTDHAAANDGSRIVVHGGADRTGTGILFGDTWTSTNGRWNRASAIRGPSPRSGHALSLLNRSSDHRFLTVLFGGLNVKNQRLNDTWEFDGNTWGVQRTAVAPPARDRHAMALDVDNGVLVLFGGFDGVNSLNDTWLYDGDNWTQLRTVLPPRRHDHAMVYDRKRKSILMFGGTPANNETMRLGRDMTGSTWQKIDVGTPPPPRSDAALVWNPSKGRVLMFGGLSASNQPLADTWVLDERGWRELKPSASPPARHGHTLTSDPGARGVIVLVGGRNQNASLRDIWEWDGTNWKRRAPSRREGYAAAYSTTSRELILFGGSEISRKQRNDTWAWDGFGWRERHPAGALPAPRDGHVMAHGQNRTLMFGGRLSRFPPLRLRDDTWEWDGIKWNLRAPAHVPPKRYYSNMSYDESRRRTVLFGGLGESGTILDDTWEWDGSDWNQLNLSPPARNAFEYAWDSNRHKLVLFGGCGAGCETADTWEWDGNKWDQRQLAVAPPPRFWHGMAYDSERRVTLVFGGEDSRRFLNDTWLFDGTNWTQSKPTTNPPGGYASLAFDSGRKRTVLYNQLGETWEWDGSDWRRLATSGPRSRFGFQLAYDAERGETVLFGGDANRRSGPLLSETWAWNGTRWTDRTPRQSSPSARRHFGFAYDSRRKKVVLFGGQNNEQLWSLGDTWEWDGTSWVRVDARSSPAAVADGSLTYSPSLNRCVFFGGLRLPANGGRQRATWEWDGTTWKQRNRKPPARRLSAMAYDPIRRRTVLFGGLLRGDASANDTWEWNGLEWIEKHPVNRPSGRVTSMAFDDQRCRVLMFGGLGATALGDTWEWDGTNWARLSPANNPSGRFGSVYFHGTRQKILMLTGPGNSTADLVSEIWEFGDRQAATYSPFGSGCGASPPPGLRAATGERPWLGSSFTVDVDNAPVGPGVLLIGGSNRRWGVIPLPLALAPFELPGCQLYVSWDLSLGFPITDSRTSKLTLRLPNSPELAGQRVFQQVVAFVGTKVALTNGAKLVFGTR